MQGGKYGSICILLYAAIWFDQHNLLQMLSVFQCVFPASLLKIRCPQVCAFLSGSSIDCIDQIVFMPILCGLYYRSFVGQLEIRNGEASCSYFSVQDCLSYPGIFMFLNEAENRPFKRCEKLCWSLMGIALNL